MRRSDLLRVSRGFPAAASRNTVREAIRFLLARGVVEKRPGAGTFVLKKTDPFRTAVSVDTGFGGFEGAAYASGVISRNRTPTVTTPRVELQEASGYIAAEFQLGQGSTVVIRHQERFIDGELWSMQTSYYPMEFVHRGASRLFDPADRNEFSMETGALTDSAGPEENRAGPEGSS
ncbi:MAG TPA: GntR family transcriptional regulator [Streptosporangiaceae bacterium]|nr:GntR family transcriptional regulator [Streptosporangiaceae bacterium]